MFVSVVRSIRLCFQMLCTNALRSKMYDPSNISNDKDILLCNAITHPIVISVLNCFVVMFRVLCKFVGS